MARRNASPAAGLQAQVPLRSETVTIRAGLPGRVDLLDRLAVRATGRVRARLGQGCRAIAFVEKGRAPRRVRDCERRIHKKEIRGRRDAPEGGPAMTLRRYVNDCTTPSRRWSFMSAGSMDWIWPSSCCVPEPKG